MVFKKGNQWGFKKGVKRNGVLNPFYGKHHTPESIAKFITPERNLKISQALKGRIITWQDKLSVSHKEQIPWNKGKTGLQVGWNKGMHPFSEETRKKMSASHIMFLNTHPAAQEKLNRSKSNPESRSKMSASHITFMNAHPETKTMLKRRITELGIVMPSKDTSIEVKLQNQLTNAEVKYEKHKRLEGRPDLYITASEAHRNLYKGFAIFADGDYWHSQPRTVKRDKEVTRTLFEDGHYVVRIRENDIRRKEFNIMDYLKEIRGD